MKKLLIFFLLLSISKYDLAQNVGIGTAEPFNKLDVLGNLMVTAPTTATSTAPTATQTKNMPGLGTLTFLGSSDSTGRLYDSGGPSGNYGIDHDAKATIASSTNIAIEMTAETMDLNTGDSLIIKESATGAILLAVGNGYNITGKWIFNSTSLYINFKSNTDFNTGTGFSLLFKRLYNNSSILKDVAGISGNAFYFNTKNGTLRSGLVVNNVQGDHSIALGVRNIASGQTAVSIGVGNEASGISSTALGSLTKASGIVSTATGNSTTASGTYATAMGNNTVASGGSSTALGVNTTASNFATTAMGYQTIASANNATALGFASSAGGEYSTAMGYNTDARGYASTAMGYNTSASGDYSTAMGANTIANGNYSTALGRYVSTNAKTGAFIIGDNSTSTYMISPVDNYFAARFAGGYRLFSNSAYTTGVTLFAGGNAWSSLSSIHTKENFAEINGEDFLQKISRFHLTSWNYKTQDPKTFRHYGPMAQDFYAAFGSDAYGTIGNDTTINSADFAGVSFIAIQALEKRTQKIKETEKQIILQQATIEEMQKQIAELKSIIHQKNIKK
ncbi:MAG TPA: tail fiber domain-containing protein [Ferruginibacter sp.]|nr:tail fiber domain-containing protein [Ferruginibacter sp.]HRE65047.1 tail fiber domain-containing protein [Ferruginibacter sp.]